MSGASQLLPPLTPVEAGAQPTIVAVTGVTGYMAGPIVQRLLAAGHTVHGTCRAPEKENTVAHLKALPGAQQRLKLFKADLLTPGAFDAVFEGATVVIHTASPNILNVKPRDVQERLIKPAVEGTENVLASVNKCPTVKRVIVTSSCTAIFCDAWEFGKDHVYTEKDWNPTASEKVMAYSYSKTLAEKRAWAIAAQQSRWRLVVVNPGGIFGPPLSRRSDGESITMMQRVANNEMAAACPRIGICNSDVRDVALAHMLAAFHPDANGRYIATSGSEWLADIVTRLSQQFPGKISKPGMAPPKWLLWLIGPLVGIPRDAIACNVNRIPIMDNSKIVNELGMTFLPRVNTMKDMIDAMVNLGIHKWKN